MITRYAEAITTVIQQKATANFDGTLPTTEPVLSPEGIYRYPAAAKGGLFYWDGAKEPMVISAILASIAAGDISVSVVNLDDAGTPIVGEEFPIESATGVTALDLTSGNFELTLLQSQALKLVTTTAGIIAVYGSIERMYR